MPDEDRIALMIPSPPVALPIATAPIVRGVPFGPCQLWADDGHGWTHGCWDGLRWLCGSDIVFVTPPSWWYPNPLLP